MNLTSYPHLLVLLDLGFTQLRNHYIVYRHSILDLVKGDNSWNEMVEVTQALKQAGVTILNAGISLIRVSSA